LLQLFTFDRLHEEGNRQVYSGITPIFLLGRLQQNSRLECCDRTNEPKGASWAAR